ncbi:MAG: hypothetical protein JSS86_13035 [Cyanobacteria bacterium SZAS LIN-2]|nr:hypothetical protein [Cyanobacteria bacterium SZAS LIN-2]
MDSKGKIRPELYSDTVHPNAAGNQVWEKALKGTINQMLQSPADHIGGPGGHTTHEVKFGPTPSWANDTSVINNNRSKVPPSFYAQRIGDHATYLEASINQPTGGFDEGEMIDERGMDPSKLTTIPMYGADNNWLTNKTNGKYYGEIQVPKDLLVLREAHTYKSGISVNGNSTVTIIDPNGKEWSFAKTYIGPDKSLRENGNVLIGVPDGHGASYMGNEGMLTLDELQRAMADGTAPAHALNLTVPNDIESNTDGGFVYPARAADHGYQTAYKGTNPNLKQGSHLAVPKGVTAEELGLKTNLGKALLASMEEFGGYVDDSTHPGAGISIEAQYGGTKQIGMEEHNGNAFRKSDFAQDFSKIMAAAKIIPPAY